MCRSNERACVRVRATWVHVCLRRWGHACLTRRVCNVCVRMDHWDEAIMDVKAHTSIVNAIDGCGGQAKGYGAPELVTSGRDGAVRVWDVRQKDAPVACFEPGDGVKARDCWSVVGWCEAE